MKKVVAIVMLVCCVGFVVVSPVLAANQTVGAGSEVIDLLNVNDATQVDLIALPGVGKVTAEKIIAFRNENGPFKSVDDLIMVKGVGKKVLEKIRPLVTI